MGGHTLREAAAVALAGGILVQLGGCAGAVMPAVLAIGEQVVLSRVFTRFLPF